MAFLVNATIIPRETSILTTSISKYQTAIGVMANDTHQLADMNGRRQPVMAVKYLAEEGEWSGLSFWQLGAWATTAISALVIAFLAVHSPLRMQRGAPDDLLRQPSKSSGIAKEGQNETRRLSSAIDTLNADRDRLYARTHYVGNMD